MQERFNAEVTYADLAPALPAPNADWANFKEAMARWSVRSQKALRDDCIDDRVDAGESAEGVVHATLVQANKRRKIAEANVAAAWAMEYLSERERVIASERERVIASERERVIAPREPRSP